VWAERAATQPTARTGWNPFQGFSALEAALLLRLLYYPRDANLRLHALPDRELRQLARLAHMFDIAWLVMGLESALCAQLARRAAETGEQSEGSNGGDSMGCSSSHGSGSSTSDSEGRLLQNLVADIELADELQLERLKGKALNAATAWLAERPHERMQATFLESSPFARLKASTLALLLAGF
jgi:hypothetical protein